MNNRVLQLDLMRVVAILFILLYHLPGYSFDYFNLTNMGINIDSSILREFSRYFGLSLFIFVSGHLANLNGRTFSDLHDIRKFVVRKVIRIFPLYYIALIEFYRLYDINEPLRVLAHMLGLQLILASPLVKPAPTLWFIGLILIYYATYILVRADKVNARIKALVLLSFPMIVFTINKTFGVMDLRIVLYYGIFLLGLYSARNDVFKRISWAQTSMMALVFAFIVMVSHDFTFTKDPFSSIGAFFMINLLMFLFINFCYKGCLALAKIIKPTRLIEVISHSSFCMFLFHRPVWSSMHDYLSKTVIIESHVMMALILALVGIPAIIILSYSIQRLYDKTVALR